MSKALANLIIVGTTYGVIGITTLVARHKEKKRAETEGCVYVETTARVIED